MKEVGELAGPPILLKVALGAGQSLIICNVDSSLASQVPHLGSPVMLHLYLFKFPTRRL